MRYFIYILIIIINFILQVTLFQNFAIATILPNTGIIIIVAIGILRDDIESSGVGFFVGLLQDIFFGRLIGFYALAYFLVGYISGKCFKNFYRINVLPIICVVPIAVLFNCIYIYFFSFLFRARLDFGYYFINKIIIEIIYTTIISIPIYYLIYFINGKLEKAEKPRRRMFNNIGGKDGRKN